MRVRNMWITDLTGHSHNPKQPLWSLLYILLISWSLDTTDGNKIEVYNRNADTTLSIAVQMVTLQLNFTI